MVRPTLFEILKIRFKAFLYGDKNGVSVNHLEKTTNGIFFRLEDLIQAEKELPNQMLNYLSESKKLFKKTIAIQQQITNTRWNAEQNLISLLYSLICIRKPSLIIETGVANGISTNAIMSALERSKGSGALHSFDVLLETSKAYKGNGNWHFHLLNAGRAHTELKNEVGGLGKPDVWLHDSNHGYRWQKFEYLLAMKFLKKGGILISDDIDASPAWAELAGSLFRKSYIVFDNRKLIGIAFK